MSEAKTEFIGIGNSSKKSIEIEIPKLPQRKPVSVKKSSKKIQKDKEVKKPRGRPPKKSPQQPKVTIVI
jgi:hypothetical protein